MALVPIAKQGNFLHIYDFKVDPQHVDDFIRAFNQFDYSDTNPMHKSPAQVKDGALVQDVKDPTRFWLIGEWADIEVHAGILKSFKGMKPEFLQYVRDNGFVPQYGKVVSATPQHILDKAQKQTA
jgi:quinol monooxygenase YgiN